MSKLKIAVDLIQIITLCHPNPQRKLHDMTIPPPPTSSNQENVPCVSSNQAGISPFISKADTKKAEVMWTLHTICNHHSYNSNTDIEKLFKAMFPEMTVENLKQQSLVAQRIICDHVTHVGGVLEEPLTQQLMASVSAASSKYKLYLDKQREEKMAAERQLKRKSDLDAIEDLKKKKARLQTDITILEEKSEKLLEKAEKTGKITFVTESNILRKGFKEKKLEVVEIGRKIQKRKEQLDRVV
jgi:hypothetical protein